MLHEVDNPSSPNGSAPRLNVPDDDTPNSAATTGDVLGAADDGVWLPPASAAIRLGISERTLWRRVASGTLTRRMVAGGAEIRVPPGGASLTVPTPDADLAVPARAETLSLAIVGELQRRLDADGERLSSLTQELRDLERENGTLAAERAADHARAELALSELQRAERAALAERDRLAADLAAERARSWWSRVWGR